ncbi:hypothetical protein NQ314_015763 [Rhamnusium bicolor]|uniref:C2H2-type domain-containing protein n=1 Tax=Rhamnusium bicolor TaxID=1586634 RepID=A0AAV8WXZ4_9CUCU|nr:hypothetical protein NQ314_015763 [Rhamnusium bicolor]
MQKELLGKKLKLRRPETPVKDVEQTEEETVQSKQPIMAPNGKIFYPCQYCNKIFPQKTTSITHMKKCPSNNSILPKDIDKKEPVINNNDEHQSKVEKNENLNSSGSSTENKSPEQRIRITQNVMLHCVKAPCQEKLVMNDTSIYDYNEEDSDESGDKDSKENEEDALNNKLCKHCKTLFDSPLDLLRHTRDCHNFPRTILPPDEIAKYFDSPNRSFCPICEKPIKTRNFRSVFIKHLLVHTTGLTHECGVCKKKV